MLNKMIILKILIYISIFPVTVSLCPRSLFSLRILFLADRSGTLCGLQLFVAHLPQCLMWCVLWCLIKSGYLNHCNLSASLSQSGLSSLTSLINNAFHTENCCLLDLFVLFFTTFSVNSRDSNQSVWQKQQSYGQIYLNDICVGV